MLDAAKRPKPQGKFGRYRAARRAAGLKMLRLWTPDPLSSGFKAQMQRR